jgi:hypothetical protein
MSGRWLICAVAFLSLAVLTGAAQDTMATSGSWSGVIMNGVCDADKAFAGLPECTQKALPGAMLVLYDDNIRHIYKLDPQDPALGMEGESVTIHGTLDGDTIHVASVQVVTAIGLDPGKKAPAFSARDQFGRKQTLATLKGSKGTVLLFFRSADW